MNANQIVEKKADTPEKLAAVAGKPTRNFLFARELNEIVARLRILWTLQNFNGSQIIPGLKKDLGTLVGQTFIEKINTSVATPFASPCYVVYTIGEVNYTQAFVGSKGTKGDGAGQVDAVDFLLVEQSDEPVEPVLNNPANYSLEEVNTGGTWIDGKPIYRKVIKGTIIDGIVAGGNISIPNADTVISLGGFFIDLDVSYPLPIIDFNFNRVSSKYYFDSAVGEVVLRVFFNSTPPPGQTNDFTSIIEYTKTTD